MKKLPENTLLHAMMHLESHHREKKRSNSYLGISMYSIAQLDYPDYAAIRILDACLDLMRYSAKGSR